MTDREDLPAHWLSTDVVELANGDRRIARLYSNRRMETYIEKFVPSPPGEVERLAAARAKLLALVNETPTPAPDITTGTAKPTADERR